MAAIRKTDPEILQYLLSKIQGSSSSRPRDIHTEKNIGKLYAAPCNITYIMRVKLPVFEENPVNFTCSL